FRPEPAGGFDDLSAGTNSRKRKGRNRIGAADRFESSESQSHRARPTQFEYCHARSSGRARDRLKPNRVGEPTLARLRGFAGYREAKWLIDRGDAPQVCTTP